MKKNIVLAVLVVLGLAVAACVSADKVDPATNVSAADMRAAVVRAQANLCGNVIPAIAALASDDLGREKPMHGHGWWDAKISLLSATATLFSDTLTGAAH